MSKTIVAVARSKRELMLTAIQHIRSRAHFSVSSHVFRDGQVSANLTGCGDVFLQHLPTYRSDFTR
jgi:hypothetical protein